MNIHRLPKAPLVLALLACFASPHAAALETYPGDPGLLGRPESWRTDEFLRDWGLRAIGAEFAYARGFSGAGVPVGAVDSGYFAAHSQLSPSRYSGVTVDGIAGVFDPLYNDRHGTHVTGTVGAARDGGTDPNNFHGVAFNANVVVGNTGKTDGVLFGLPQAVQTPEQTIDNAHVANVYRAVAATGGRIITTSFGSQPNSEQYQTLFPTTGTNLTGRVGLMGAWGYLSGSTGADTWFRGTLDAAKGGAVIVFSAGNTGYANPSARAAAAYFDPTLEDRWLAAAAIRQVLTVDGVPAGQTDNADGSVAVPGAQLYNQCGIAKWSCMTAPGNTINGSTVTVVDGVPTETYGALSGTSMAAPHASGALAVVMERFGYMSNEQALSVLKTTAVQNGTVNDANGVAIRNPNAGQRTLVPDDRNGWGTVSLRNTMNGPGQFTGRFAVDTKGQSDVWSSDISDTAIRARKAEDATEAATWNTTQQARGWVNGLPTNASPEDKTEYEVGTARETARNSRVYVGSLAKSGDGTIVLSGENSFSGGTTLAQGGLVAASAHALGSGDVNVTGGTLSTRSASTVKIGGNLTLGRAATLDLGLGLRSDASAGWLLDIDGLALFDGTLALSFLDGVTFGAGLYDLISFDSYQGRFSDYAFNGLDLDDGYFASILYTEGGVELSIAAVPEPETWALMLGGLAILGWAARRRRAAA
jgi:autotransporter-associated beta strand protein